MWKVLDSLRLRLIMRIMIDLRDDSMLQAKSGEAGEWIRCLRRDWIDALSFSEISNVIAVMKILV